MANKQERIASIIRKNIVEIIQFEIRDPKLGFVSIPEVRVSKDFSYATVYVSFLKEEDEDGNPIYEDDEADAINLLQGLGYVIYKPATEEEVADDADADVDADEAVDDDFAGEDDEDF